MIQVNLLGVQQNFDFSTKKIRSFVVFEVGGKKIHAEVEDINEVQALVSAGLNGSSFPTKPAPQPISESSPQYSREETERVVDWTKISDEVIPPQMKKALRALEVPQSIDSGALRELMNVIQAEFTQDDWDSVEVATPAPVPQEEVPVPQPQTPLSFSVVKSGPQYPPVRGQALGHITWHDGSPILPGRGARAKTVPADEYGYPIVSNAGVDPGEVVGGGDEQDEDGVGQF
jgi:hypothetical protein